MLWQESPLEFLLVANSLHSKLEEKKIKRPFNLTPFEKLNLFEILTTHFMTIISENAS